MLTDRSRIARTLCSTLAIATALIVGTGIAHAQTAPGGSFQGNGTFASGSGTITTGSGTTTINLSTTDAVINWTTFDSAIGGGPINFQPSGTTATFNSAADFSVLNRIMPTDPSRAVQFNGNVVTTIQNQFVGGTVYFYSPGGVIVGSSAVFNVGNLGLTSIAPEVVGGVFEQTGTNGDFIRLNGAVTPGSAVSVQAGAQINASGYVGIVAPLVDQRGTINAGVGTTLVSADAATITFRPSGLFDIQVTSGTSGTGTTLYNSGTITGPAFSGSGPQHRIYAVAVPKNTAITLAIASGSTLGFDVAGSANVSGNAVVLSAGRDILNGNIANGPSAGGGTGAANLAIEGNLTSALNGTATGTAYLFSRTGNNTSAASIVNLRGIEAKLSADGAGSTTTVAGNVSLASSVFGGSGGADVTGGTSEIFAINGGAVSLNAAANLNASATGGIGIPTVANGGTGTGGVAIIQAQTGGTVSVAGAATLNTVGTGGAAFTGGGNGGAGVGGRSQVFASGAGSSVTINGALSEFSNGRGGVGVNGLGGSGTGGQAFINAQTTAGASISIGGAAVLQAIGTGGNDNGGSAGTGTGGTAVAAASDNNSLQFGAALDVFAFGFGGSSTGGNAGSSQGGNARINLFNNGSLSVAGTAQVFAIGQNSSGNGATATATGGMAQVTSQQTSTLRVSGSLVASSSGLGAGDVMTPNGQGGGIGGTTTVSASTGGTIAVGAALRARSAATATGNRNATAGSANVSAFTGGAITANELNINVNAVGGSDLGSGAGSGIGGTATLRASGAGSSIAIANGNTSGIQAIGDLDFITAQGTGGQNNGGGSGVGGSATGGLVTLDVNSGATLRGPANTGTQSYVRIIARAYGGDASAGVAGGQATGGIINITVDNATLTSADLLPSSFAQGGSAASTATGTINGGNAIGGQRNINVRNGATMSTSFSGGGPGAQGGNGTLAGRGGDASGGSASLVIDNATLTLTGRGVVFSQNQAGAGGTAGNVSAGSAFARVANGGVLNVADDGTAAPDFGVTSNAFGAFGPATPGIAQGSVTAGTATLLLQGGTISGGGSISVQASAFANSDQYAQGGTYRGGTANLSLQGGAISTPQVFVDASATGADVGTGITGIAGSGAGGDALVQTGSGSSSLTTVTIEARGTGGNVVGTGVGGAGTGGTGEIFANGGAISLSGSLTIDGGGKGGAGGNGGAGGDGVAGSALVNAVNNVTRASALTLNAVTLHADGLGGAGGAGSSGGGTGGIGGSGSGGGVQVLAGAGNGTHTTGAIIASAIGTGGAGGLGGIGATGGTGGAGGRGLGGFISVGTASLLDNSPTNTGSGTYGATSEDASAFGGTGGAGGSGTTQGVGGRGGDAFDGRSIILVRGSPVTFNGAVSLLANATGGNGGAGSLAGAGGNATVGTDPVVLNSGGIGVTVTNRFQHPEQPGRLSAGIITGIATATGGSGSTPGASLLADQPFRVEFTNSTGTINTLDLRASATSPLTTAAPSTLTMTNATASISNLTLITSGTLSVALDASALNTTNLTLSAANFLLPATRPTSLGTINVSGSSSITSLRDLLAFANFNVRGSSAFNFSGSLLTGDLISGGPLDLTATGSLTTGNVQASNVVLNAGGALVTGAVGAGSSIKLTAVGTATTGQLTAGDSVTVLAGGAVNVAGANAGTVNPSTVSNATYKLAIASSGGSVTAGSLNARRDVGVQALQNISTGSILGRDVLLLAGGSVSTGAITAVNGTQPTGRVYIGNYSMATQTANVFSPFTALTLFNLEPVRIGGAITIGGGVTAGSLVGSAAQGISLQAVTTPAASTQSGSGGFIDLDSGGTVTVNGRLAAGRKIDIASRDIDITQTGSLDALSVTGEIELASNNPNGAFIGDGLSATSGYGLSNAEYARLKAGQLTVVGDDISGLATDMTIGDLSIAGSQLYGPGGIAVFATGNRSTETPSGILRIVGAVTGNGFAPTNEINLLSGTVELETAKGSLKINGAQSDGGTSSTQTLGGFVYIEADHIHVADDGILTKLRADPFYTGRISELNAPAAVQRTDGVLNALGFEVRPGSTFYIQNTGTRVLPAGFVTTFDATDIFAPSRPPTNGVSIVLNGQFKTATGTATGITAFNLVKADPTPDSEQFAGFSSDSQLNGCVFLSGGCAFGQTDPVAALSSEISVVTYATLDESPVAPTADDSDEGGDDSNDNKDDDDDTSDEGSSPIAPPVPLISTRALDGDVNVVEPVSGAGNPALFGSAVDETTAKEEKP